MEKGRSIFHAVGRFTVGVFKRALLSIWILINVSFSIVFSPLAILIWILTSRDYNQAHYQYTMKLIKKASL